jgi:beta-glucosidase/6-phospho-beta-glucosidase/beta-galactosidase
VPGRWRIRGDGVRAGLGFGTLALGTDASRLATSHPDAFAWALGIEDTFIPHVVARTGRILDEYELTGHYTRWREDLDRIRSLGVRHLRWGIPWYRVEPRPGQFDWAWTDEVLRYMVEVCGIRPIVDLMHYGAPLWLEGTFLAPDYPQRVAAYAAAAAERYAGLATDWTPLNEPRVHAHFAGRAGIWPPYRRGPRGYAAVLVALAAGMQQTIAALRSVHSAVRIVHVDAMASVSADDPALQEYVRDRLEQQFLAADLVEGRVTKAHPMWRWLTAAGVPEATLAGFLGRPQRMDVMGGNYYPQMSRRVVAGDVARPVARRAPGSGADLEATLRRWHERAGRPVMLTETSVFGPVWKRARWLEESVAAMGRLLDDGIPLTGYTWFPAFSLFAWSYQRGRRPREAYLAHMGLWDLRGPALERVETRLVDRYRELVSAGAPSSSAGRWSGGAG